MKQKSRLLFSLVVLAALLAPAALAHERQAFEIGDKTYLLVIGSLNEPVFVDDKTGVDLRVLLADPENPGDSSKGTPVPGLDAALKVDLMAGDKTKTLAFSPVYNSPGAYKAEFYPTVATTLTYRVYGAINDVPVDLTFSCNPAGHPAVKDDTERVMITDGVTRVYKSGAFGCPRPRDDLGFPEPMHSIDGLHQQLHERMMNKGLGVCVAALVVALLALGVALWRRR